MSIVLPLLCAMIPIMESQDPTTGWDCYWNYNHYTVGEPCADCPPPDGNCTMYLSVYVYTCPYDAECEYPEVCRERDEEWYSRLYWIKEVCLQYDCPEMCHDDPEAFEWYFGSDGRCECHVLE